MFDGQIKGGKKNDEICFTSRVGYVCSQVFTNKRYDLSWQWSALYEQELKMTCQYVIQPRERRTDTGIGRMLPTKNIGIKTSIMCLAAESKSILSLKSYLLPSPSKLFHTTKIRYLFLKLLIAPIFSPYKAIGRINYLGFWPTRMTGIQIISNLA